MERDRPMVTMDTLIENHRWRIDPCRFLWPWVTSNPSFKVTQVEYLKNGASYGQWFYRTLTGNHMQSTVPLSMTLSDLWPGFQGHDILWSRISEKSHVLKTKLLLRKRKVYLTYWMVLCLSIVWWPWLTYKRVARVCQHQLSFLFRHAVDPWPLTVDLFDTES